MTARKISFMCYNPVMSEVHLTKSPLREAVIDFKFNYLEEVDIAKLE